jgi:hypothetical protein
LDADAEQPFPWARALRARLERHPRTAWRNDATPAARFWLEIHDGFRRDSDRLMALLDEHRGRRAATEQFARDAATELAVVSGPRLKSLVVRLRGHHEIEDFEYFPAFRALEPVLAQGFDALERDHARLQRHVDDALTALSVLLAAAENGAAAAPWAIDRYASGTGELCGALARHLDDEEELIIPLLLERG